MIWVLFFPCHTSITKLKAFTFKSHEDQKFKFLNKFMTTKHQMQNKSNSIVL